MKRLACFDPGPGVWISALLIAIFLVLPLPVGAVLGDNATSVLSDQARMRGTLSSRDLKAYVVHEITVPGTVVREFVSSTGVVFGVSWEGQFPPDFQQLLGPYYQQARQSTSQQPYSRRAPIAVDTPGLVFLQTGHPRSFHGAAYIPQLVPNGTPVSDIR